MSGTSHHDQVPAPADAGSREIEIQAIDGRAAASWAPEVWSIYDAVFGDATDYESWRADMFERHAAREEYRLVVALDEGRVVGFAWGYAGERGQYWPDLVHAALPAGVHRRCLLGTSDDEADPAVRLYLRSGWRRLGALRPGVQVLGREVGAAPC